MEAKKLATEVRDVTGKNAARQLRAAGQIPGVLYGGEGESISLKLSPKDLAAALSSEHRRNQLLELDVAGQAQLAIVQELQVDPVTRAPLHVDFCRVTAEAAIARKVPFVTKGRAAGVVAGGDLRVLYRHLPVSAPPQKMPPKIEVDVTEMQVGDTLQVKGLPLEDGVTVTLPEERNVVTITVSRRKAKATTDEAESTEAES